MIELFLTSFPFLIRLAYLRRRGIPVTLYNVHRALFLWFVLALIVFFTVFYYYPKSYSGIVTFRTVPVVAQIGGPVTEVLVESGDHVEAGDLLFTIDDATQLAAVAVAKSAIEEVETAIEAAAIQVETVTATVAGAQTFLEQAEMSLNDQLELQKRGSAAYQESQLERAQNLFDARFAELEATKSRLATAKFQMVSVLSARLRGAKASLNQAEVELAKTQVRSLVNGKIEQLTLHAGARASQLALNPAIVIIPDRSEEDPLRIAAGFSQVTRKVLYEGMAAEVACESNFNIGMQNTILPARVTRIQSVVAAGQLAPSGRLMEPSERAKRGEIVVQLTLVYPEHQELLIPGSGCMVQAYTTHVTGPLEGGLVAHGIEALGALKAVLVRVKVWVALAAGIGLSGGAH